MIDPQFTDKEFSGIPTRRNVSPVMLSIVVALALALAAGYYVHVKNQKIMNPPANKTINTATHAN